MASKNNHLLRRKNTQRKRQQTVQTKQ